MKRILLVFGFCVLHFGSFAQQGNLIFSLTDTVFTVGAIYKPATDIIFSLDNGRLDERSKPCLDTFAQFMVDHPGIIIEIRSHTDQRGSDSFNLKLSQFRANEVKRYLESRGVQWTTIPAVGYGETQPIHQENEIQKLRTKDEQEQLYQENRRTEFRILRTPRITFKLTDTTFTQGAYLFYPMKFALARATIDSSCYTFLDSMAIILIAHRELHIQVSNHVDTRYNSKYASSALSSRRAQSVVDYLVSKGVLAEQLTAKGYDDVAPIVPDKITYAAPGKEGQENLHAINRRTEFRIIKINPQ